jgi:hypothetical protein
MADTTAAAQLDELIATTFDKVKPVLADQITVELPLLAALNAKSRVTEDGGLTIRRPVMYAFNDTVGSYSGYDLIDTTPQDGFGYAEYDWKQYAGSVTISGRDERLNAGSSRIVNLLAAKFDQLRVSMEDDLNAMLFADVTTEGNSGKNFLSVPAIVGNGTTTGATGKTTLGGIDSDSDGQSWWRSTVRDGLDLTTLDGMRTLGTVYNDLRISKSRPDIIITDQGAFEALEALALPNLRFTDTKMADLGFQTVAFKDAAVLWDDDAPDDEMYLLNSNHLEFVRHNQAWMKMLPFASPVNQDARTALVISMGELLTDCRRAHGRVINITSGE